MSLNIKTATGRQVLASNGDVLVGGRDYEVYSENETMIGYWKDGKPIYRKVFNVNSPNIVDQNINVITPTDFNFDVVDEVVNIYGKLSVMVGNNEFVYPLNMYIYNGVLISCWYRTKDNGIGMNVHGNTDILNRPTTIIFEYTKTTDTPVVDTNTYSTEEKLTGETWIDGKPIYRKVINFTSPSTADTDVQVALFTNSFDQIIHFEGKTYDFPLNHYRNSTVRTQTWIVSGRIFQNVSSYFINKPSFAIVEYTKTTD